MTEAAGGAGTSRRQWIIRGVALLLIITGLTLLVRAANRPKDPVFKPAASARTAVAGFGEIAYRIDTKAKTSRCALLADTPQQQQQGLMGRTNLAGHDGMLFRFSQVHSGMFWMKDTIMPLSIAYFDADGKFVSANDMEPCLNRGDDCPLYPAGGPYKYALEVEKGGLGRLGIASGAHLSVAGGCS